MECQEYRVGVKIPWPGYLILHPVLCLGNLKKSKLGSNKRSNIFICNSSIEKLLYFIDLSNISLCMSRIVGGGEDRLAGVSYPPPSFMYRKS